ncbi:hypothetical protein DAETH_29080 [Deinococcus aetherius]|uniref:Uncharacterized protein n=1 Tax=Deinococcus aetherius TaxID=200252 RepID=A0ABM8AGV9_9DEIO|nr:hypothetical protein [Deinococcus aetherius]BDP42939.1 hypothetical protein DAETH_29080 [Deinococcus aetherius]
MRDLLTRLDTAINGPLSLDPGVSYLLNSSLRVLCAWAALLAVRNLVRYTRAALPPPHALVNVVYWLRWWFWLRLREFPLLKVGAALLALALLAQVATGAAGTLARLTVFFVWGYGALFLALVGLAQFLAWLTARIQHPERSP